MIGSRYGFLMSSERAVRKRNIPSEASHEPQRLEYVQIKKNKHSFLVAFEVVVRMRNVPHKLSSPEIVKIIGSRYRFLMSFET